MTRSILVGEVRTGRRIATIPVSGAAWSVAHRGVGDISVDIPLDAGEFRKLERNLSGVWRPSGGVTVTPATVGNPLVDRTYATDNALGSPGTPGPYFSVLPSVPLPAGILQSFQYWNQVTPGPNTLKSAGNAFHAYLLRPDPAVTNKYTVIYDSGLQIVPVPTNPAGEVATVAVPSVPVAAGDVIGVYGQGIPFDVNVTTPNPDRLSYPAPVAPALNGTMTLGVSPGFPIFPQNRRYSFGATVLTTTTTTTTHGLRPEFLNAIEPARTFMAVLEGDAVICKGPIWAHDYDYGTGILKVKAASSMASIFDHRIVMGIIADPTLAAQWAVTYPGLSLGTIAKRLIQLLMSHTGGNLPIVLPDDETAANDADHTRTYRGFEMATGGARINELMGVINGPDIRFDPRLTADRMGIEDVMRVGTEAQPLLYQVGGDHVFDARVPRGGVSGLSVHRDAGGLASRSWATGSGMDEALLMARDDDPTLTDGGYPLLEVSESRSTVEVQSTLDSWAAGNLSAAAAPWMTWSATVRADMSPLLGSYRVGDFAKVWVPRDHPYLSLLLPAGFHRARIVNFSGDLGPNVNLTFAPVMESR